MKKLKYMFAALVFGSFFLLPATPVLAEGTSSNQACEVVGSISPGGAACGSVSGPKPDKIIKLAINILSLAAGVIAVIMLVVSGLKYITSQGDAAQVSSAKSSLVYAIVGLVVVAFAQFLVKFVLSKGVGQVGP